MNTTEAFLRQLDRFAGLDLTPDVLHQIRRCVLDYIGVTYAGRKWLADRLLPMLEGSAPGPCSVIGSSTHTEPYRAAFLNGFAAHVIELDDGHRCGAPHLEAPILSALIAVAQQEDIPFDRFAHAVLIGYEATIRLSTAVQPSHKTKGFHATGVCGTVGVACAVGHALGLDRDQMKSALSAAATSAAGLLQVIDDDSELKPYNVSGAAVNGIRAAYMGRCGLNGPDDVLGGKRGFLKAFSDAPDLTKLLDASERPSIFQIYVKPYAACRHAHAPIECALKIRGRVRLEATRIADIEVETYKLAIDGHDAVSAGSVSAAKMSTPYGVAAAIILGTCGMEAYTKETLERADIKALALKVRIVENEELTRACPAKRGAILHIRMVNGDIHTECVEYPLGEPENNMSDAQMLQKFESLMSYAGVPAGPVKAIEGLVLDIENSYNELLTTI